MPSQLQHRQHRGGLERGAVVAVQHRFVDAACRPSASAVRRTRLTSVIELSLSCTSKPTILRLIQVEDQVQVKPASHAHARAGTSCPSTRPGPAPWRYAWWVGASGVAAWRGRGGSSARARAAPDGSSIRWRCRCPRRRASARCARAGSRRSGVGWPRRRCGRVPPPSARAKVAAGSRPAAGRPGSARHACASAGRCAGRSRPARRRAPAARRRPGPH